MSGKEKQREATPVALDARQPSPGRPTSVGKVPFLVLRAIVASGMETPRWCPVEGPVMQKVLKSFAEHLTQIPGDCVGSCRTFALQGPWESPAVIATEIHNHLERIDPRGYWSVGVGLGWGGEEGKARSLREAIFAAECLVGNSYGIRAIDVGLRS